MHPLVRKLVKFLKLSYLWVVRIVFAPNRFKVPLLPRLYHAIAGGYMPDQIMLYDFKHQDKHAYLSEFDWYRSRWINEPFDPMLNNKIVCTEVLKPFISVPHISFIKNRGRYMDASDHSRFVGVDEAIRVLQEQKTVFMKPIGAGKGKGVYRLDASGLDDEQESFFIDTKFATREELAALLKSENNWFYSGYVEQSSFLNSIYAETSNTIRFITIREPETGEYRLLFAVLRIGTSDTVPVDNGSRGGLVAAIDPETGELSEARTLWSLDVHVQHPDSQAPIKGQVIPDWDALKARMLSLAAEFPYLNFVAWDILLTDDEPCIIEANTSSGVNIIQLWGPQRYGALGDFYRAHKVIK